MSRIPEPVMKQVVKLKPTKKGVARGVVGGGVAATAAHFLGGQNPATSQGRKAKVADDLSMGVGGAGIAAGAGAMASKRGLLGKAAQAKVGSHRPGKALFAASTGAALVAAYHVAKRDRQQNAPAKQSAINVTKAAVGLGVSQKGQTLPEPRAVRSINKGRAAAKGRSQTKGSSF